MKIIDYLRNQTIDVQIEELGKTGTGYNSPTIIKANGVKGYKKRSRNCKSFDSFEYLISILGKLLNIKVAETYCFDDGSIFSKSVTNEGEEFITIEDISKIITVTDKEFAEKQEFDKNLESFVYNDRNHYVVKTSEEIEFVINIFIRMIDKLNIENKNEIIKDYIRMCFFDCLTGNKDRVNGNFGLIKSGDKLSFAPLFDSSTIAMPNIDDNLVQINNYYIDRNALLDFIINKYSNYVEDILNADIDSIRGILEDISKKLLSEEDKKWFDSMITNNILASLLKKKEQISKIETTNQSIHK